MMALQLKGNGTATYYQSAEFCRNYSSPPVSYGDSSHYFARLPGKKPYRITPTECQQSLCAKMEKKMEINQLHLQMAKKGKRRHCFCAVSIIILRSFGGLQSGAVWTL